MPSTYSLRSEAHRCDECGREMVLPTFCDGCGADYPERRRMSPFALLGLPVVFDLGDDVIEGREMELTRRLHPDRWQGRGDVLYRRAVLAQGAANEAVTQVKDPFSRAELLLLLNPEADVQGLNESGRLDQAFLVEQLALQEEIADGIDPDRRRTLQRRAKAEQKTLVSSIQSAFLRGDLGGVRVAIDQSRYWRNLARVLQGRADRET